MRVLDRKVVVTLSIYTVEASNEDEALVNDIRKKDMINNLKVIMTFVIIEPLDWRPIFYALCSQQFAKRDDGQKRWRKEQTWKKAFSYTAKA